MTVKDLTPAELSQILDDFEKKPGPGYVIEKTLLRSLIEEVSRRRAEAKKRAERNYAIKKGRQ